MRRAIFRGICVAGLLACIVTIVAPVAYGDEGLVGDVPEPPPVVTSTVTEVTQTAPAAEGVVEPVNNTTAPVTETVTNVTNNTNVAQPDVPVVETTEVVQNVPSTSVATSTPDAPATSVEAPVASSSNEAPAAGGGTTAGTDTGVTSSGGTSGGTSASGPTSTTTGSAPSTRPAFSNTSTSFMPPAERGSLRSAPGVFFAQAGDSPEDILDELLDIGNSVGIDQVRGLQITNARGSNDGPESSGAPSSTPAPLALTGIAVGAFLAIGFGLLVAGSGARAAGSTTAA